jgi:hypothetical protein
VDGASAHQTVRESRSIVKATEEGGEKGIDGVACLKKIFYIPRAGSHKGGTRKNGPGSKRAFPLLEHVIDQAGRKEKDDTVPDGLMTASGGHTCQQTGQDHPARFTVSAGKEHQCCNDKKGHGPIRAGLRHLHEKNRRQGDSI